MDAMLRPVTDLRKLNRDLRAAADGRELRKELSREWRGILTPIKAEVQAAYRAGPSGRGKARRKGGSLRGALARATRVEVRTTGKLAGARIRVDGRRMPPGMGSLPAMWEGPPQGKRWRHPVYGDRDVWVSQQSHPTFYRVTAGREAGAFAAADHALGAVGRKLERGTI
jgi:hypothetical protein